MIRGALAVAREIVLGQGALALRAVGPVPRPPRTPLVSVVIATYNWSSVLRHAIASALAQTYPEIEVIVVGDGCTDDTDEVVASFDDPRVRWLPLPRNSGSQSAPNNAGIEAARGEIVAYLGHDDLWLPDHLVRLVDVLESGRSLATAVTLALGPPGSRHRALAGHRPFRPGSWLPPSGLAHRRELVDAVGRWRDYRELVEPPDVEFVARAVAWAGPPGRTRALTVLKLNSAWRAGAYALRRDDEQRALAARLTRPRATALVEIARTAWHLARRPSPTIPATDPVPDVVPPGWYVDQWRRIRGLEDDGGKTPPGEAASQSHSGA